MRYFARRLSEFAPYELGRSRGGATGAGILELRGDDTKKEFARCEIFWCVRRIPSSIRPDLTVSAAFRQVRPAGAAEMRCRGVQAMPTKAGRAPPMDRLGANMMRLMSDKGKEMKYRGFGRS